MAISSYISTENLNITYLFGAGASYNSVPIWNKQGETMLIVAQAIEDVFRRNLLDNNFKSLFSNEILIRVVEKIRFYATKAEEFGTLDIYAKSLFLLEKQSELNDLKYHLSIYFDIWENFLYKESFLNEVKGIKYTKIDKRYYSLLSVLLEKGEVNPQLNKKINFVSWNYDLQLERAYKSFMLESENNNLEDVNENFKFFNSNNKENRIAHLNGFRGFFNYKDKIYPNVEKKGLNSIEDYLLNIIDNNKQFSTGKVSYSNNIKYSWESNQDSLVVAREIMSKTNVLIIIGYSFPTYNRLVDSDLFGLLASKSESKIRQVVIQNPSINIDLIDAIIPNHFDKKIIENTNQFHIPDEFLFPQKAKPMFF